MDEQPSVNLWVQSNNRSLNFCLQIVKSLQKRPKRRSLLNLQFSTVRPTQRKLDNHCPSSAIEGTLQGGRSRTHSRPIQPTPPRNFANVTQPGHSVKQASTNQKLALPPANIEKQRRLVFYRRSNARKTRQLYKPIPLQVFLDAGPSRIAAGE